MFIKLSKMKPYILNCIFCHFEFVVCFVPFLHEAERNVILDLGSTAYNVKSKWESGDTPISRVWLCENPHGSMVKAEYVPVIPERGSFLYM